MPTLDIDGESFACRESLPVWQLMELAKSQQADEIAQLAGMHDFILAVLTPPERDRFRAFMRDWQGDHAALEAAVGALMESYSPDRPTGRPSASPPGPPSTGGSSRVVSLSRGTASKAPTSSKAGRSAAS